MLSECKWPKKRLNYPEFVDFVNMYDLFCISETHLDEYDIVDLNGFHLISKHRMQNYRRKSGGIGIYIKDNISQYVHAVPNNSEYILWVSIS